MFRDLLLNTRVVYFWVTCFQSLKISMDNHAIKLNLGYPFLIHSSCNSVFAHTVSSALSLNLDQPLNSPSLSIPNPN